MLVLQVERLSALLPTVVADFTNAPDALAATRANARANTPVAEAYRDVKRRVTIDQARCDEIYESRFVRHFYAPPAIKSMKRRWTQEG
jgi:hypothetical protein